MGVESHQLWEESVILNKNMLYSFRKENRLEGGE